MEHVRASIVIPLYGGVDLTRQCLRSMVDAGFDARDELILVDNASIDATPRLLDEVEAEPPFALTVVRNEDNRNFAGACNQGTAIARGEWTVFLNNDTVVTPGWLDAMIDEATASGADVVGARLLYPDGRIQHAGVTIERGIFPRHLHRLAPGDRAQAGTSYDCQIVTAACMLARTTLVRALGGFDEAFVNGCEDIDLCLRARNFGARVRYCGRAVVIHLESQAPGRNDNDLQNARLLNEHWRDRVNADRIACDRIVTVADPRLPWRLETPRVASIVIPAHGNVDDTKRCVESIIACGIDDSVEIIVVDNASTDGTERYLTSMAGVVRSIRNDRNYDFSGGCNQGAAHATGRYVVFLNNDTIVEPGWLDALLSPLDADERVGAVGGRLLYPDGSVQHAGVAFGEDRIGYHVHAGADGEDPRVTGRRVVQAVTGACMAVRRTEFIAMDGFDQRYHNGCEDLDLCMRLIHERKRAIVYEPACSIVHLESRSAGRLDDALPNLARFLERWATRVVPDEHTYGVSRDADAVIAPTGRRMEHGIVVTGIDDVHSLRIACEAVADRIGAGSCEVMLVVDPSVIAPASLHEAIVLARIGVDLPEIARVNHALSLVTAHEVAIVPIELLAASDTWTFMPHTVLERAGGLDLEAGDLDPALAQLSIRARMAGVEVPDALTSGCNPRHGVGISARHGVHLPVWSASARGAEVSIDACDRSVLVPFEIEDAAASEETLGVVLAALAGRPDVTIVVRTGPYSNACLEALERAARCTDSPPDIVVVEGDARCDASLCAVVDDVVCEGRRGWALAGIARHVGSHPIRSADVVTPRRAAA